jgi:hypothetical protein
MEMKMSPVMEMRQTCLCLVGDMSQVEKFQNEEAHKFDTKAEALELIARGFCFRCGSKLNPKKKHLVLIDAANKLPDATPVKLAKTMAEVNALLFRLVDHDEFHKLSTGMRGLLDPYCTEWQPAALARLHLPPAHRGDRRAAQAPWARRWRAPGDRRSVPHPELARDDERGG